MLDERRTLESLEALEAVNRGPWERLADTPPRRNSPPERFEQFCEGTPGAW